MNAPYSIQGRLAALGFAAADVDERFVRGSGPGGQKINKTSSTVWLRHGPTGLEVRCQAERSQAANRDQAWRELCAKLEARIRTEKDAARQEHEKARRRSRQKNWGQKVAMIQAKKHRARHKAGRSRVSDDG
jgi:protein subunit release factor B